MDHRPLTFAELRRANLARLPEFKNSQGQPAHSELDGSDWCLAQWSNATLGELGEAANIIKKIDRGDMTLDEARPLLANELADVQTYLDLLAYRAGIDLGPATIQKWNAVSERVGSKLRLGEGPTHYVHRNPANAVFVKTAEFFVSQGGLVEPWGKAWSPVTVDGDPGETLEDARRVGQQHLPPYGVSPKEMP